MLDSLLIKNFRSLADFEVPRMGRINLIVGKNNSGKSSVLEALRIYAGNAQQSLLESIAVEHDEKYRIKEGEKTEPDMPLPFQDFFTGRVFPTDDGTAIEIGSLKTQADRLRIQHAYMVEAEETVVDEAGETTIRIRRRPVLKSALADCSGEIRQALLIQKGEKSHPLFLDAAPLRLRPAMLDAGTSIACSVIPTQFISLDELADEWDKIAFEEPGEVVRQAMRIITPEFEDLMFVRNEERLPTYRQNFQRSAKVKLTDMPRGVPLNSLGDGMVRVLQLALKIFPAKGGFLLIDEFENGLHYSIQEKIWALLFEMSLKLDIQIFATTHSWDCIESFTKVAIARTDVDGVLFRMGRSQRTSDRGRVIATVFDEAALNTITQSNMEVR
jgi:predicted ATPase